MSDIDTIQTTPSAGTIATAAAVAAGAVLLAGCGGGGGGGGAGGSSQGPALVIDAITIAATPSAAAVVTVDTVTATANAVRFSLSGGGAATARAADPGYRQAELVYPFAIAATATGSAASATADCYVAINPAPQRVITGEPALQLKHLFNRIGFGASDEDLGRWLNIPYATAVARIIDEAGYARTTQPPAHAASFRPLTWQAYDRLSTSEQKAYGDRKGKLIEGIYAWWWREIITSPQPLLEKMALFWHNHLVVSVGDVFEPRAAWDYLDLLRRNALGSFRTMLFEIARDPAMVMFLDSNSNRKGRPNENFARELMELFTLGEGHVYSEQDVVEVAKCFTGWGLDETAALNQSFAFWQTRHEPGVKTVLGTAISNSDSDPEQVRKDGEAVLDRILTESRVAVFICEKLWDEFIGGTRDDGVIASWATVFRDGGYEIRPLLQAMLTDAAFTDAGNRGNMLRSPVELSAAIFRGIRIEPDSYVGYHWRASEEDQALLNPPNVRGWVGGLSWISTRSLLARRQHMGWTGWELTGGSAPDRVPPHLVDGLELLWFATPPADTAYIDDAVSITWDPVGERIRRLLVDPALNCK